MSEARDDLLAFIWLSGELYASAARLIAARDAEAVREAVAWVEDTPMPRRDLAWRQGVRWVLDLLCDLADAGQLRAMAEAGKDTPTGGESTPPAGPLTVYRAEYDPGIPLDTYTTTHAARAHCEATVRREYPEGASLCFRWVPDDFEDDPVQALYLTVERDEESRTGYVVVPVAVASAYDPDGDA